MTHRKRWRRSIRSCRPGSSPLSDRLLEKDPSKRFGSAKEVSELLEGCLAHVQQPASVPLPAALRANRSAAANPGGHVSRRHTGVIAMFATCRNRFLRHVLLGSAEPPDIAGEWTGEEWGTVVLKKTNDEEYTGTYTDTFGKKPGEIQLKWSPHREAVSTATGAKAKIASANSPSAWSAAKSAALDE